MKCYASPVALLTLFLTFFASAQDSYTDLSNKYLTLDIEESIISSTTNSGNHTTLIAALKAAGMHNALAFDGPFTVFAPSDKALNALFSNTGTDLFKAENKSDLQALLRYHIIAGKFSASKILRELCRGQGKATFMTVQGEVLTATIDGIDIVLTDSYGNSAKIITADSDQCNGIIHEIDSVILPKTVNFLP
ncbi:fasciclin domain-containing protein [Maribacter polysiphoniae]|uniref:Fasciclin domain-containing protein n=1 Tax=Maribacter polysiphoniae TaxID=429344 RepID=A0A316E021_9FLAO|nr:fasciclin domain-containing protein [Maribacter polysiphoniae]MBD1261283.1 fasciclin domain-containing protein [Maribacter polysiphoniae]PWK23475.1 putative surface protein with fasciclin (FAS1) repeats [Maribacter polysiphoniae]